MRAGDVPLVIAEAGVNHNGRLNEAIALVRAAKKAGADIVKFQHFRAEAVVAAEAATAAYQQVNTGTTKQYDLLKGLELNLSAFARLSEVCKAEEIAFLCTAFDVEAMNSLVDMGMPFMKIPSGELTNTPYLRKAASFGLPILLSTGMASLDEVDRAVSLLRSVTSAPITLLQCTSLYPAPAESLNLTAIRTMQSAFGLPVGLSDHSTDDYAAIAAVALGATVIEKHFTRDRSAPGPDHQASLEPEDFARMVRRLKETARAMGDGIKRPTSQEVDTARVVRRSWHAARDLASGQIITEADVLLKRPLGGLSPDQSPIGKRLKVAVRRDVPILAGNLDDEVVLDSQAR